jgi:uncharacterized protein YndB with AHSA1/START domain
MRISIKSRIGRKEMSENISDTDAVVISRSFEAPVDLVWRLWTDPAHFKKWYGPEGFSVPVAEIDLRVGGRRLICMSSPDGSMQMWTTGQHKEIVPNTRLVYSESPADEDGNVVSPAAMGMPDGYPAETEVTVVLEDLVGKTRMVLTHAGIPAGSPGQSGWEQAFDKMKDYIKTIQIN